ncbi:MAG: hypothetical protein MUP98_01515 [Candidatus Aminicenantes bacterium]|nr:hypothetical protein [Candidatus Aminicenantes bacterium]
MSCKKKQAESYFSEFTNFSVKIPWDCFVYILTNFLQFEMINKRGSKRLFINGEIRFTADEPHGRGDDYIYKEDRRRALNEISKIYDFKKKVGEM